LNDLPDELGVPKIVQPSEMIHPKVDELAMMTYISYYRDLDGARAHRNNEASKCRAYGPGLVNGVVNQPGEFVVETPKNSRGRLQIKVEGPRSEARVTVQENGDGTYNVSYNPTEPGTYKVHVTLDGVHIPGSIFTVTVLAQESLGGEGKIRIFYSTTTASNEKTRPLQELLEAKKVHLRPDFEPWIAVDIMERDDREAVFRKAGTRALPIVYIDDSYVGDYYRIVELNDSGELDRLLKLNEGQFNRLFGGNSNQFASTSARTTSAPTNRSAPASSSQPRQVTVQQTTVPPSSATRTRAPSSNPPVTGTFCAQCGTKFNNAVTKFCSSCGTPRNN